MSSPTSIQTYTIEGLLKSLEQFNKESGDRSIVFLLGAGASVTSNIPAGTQLAKKWLKEIHEREDAQCASRGVEAWATPETLGPGFENFEFVRAAEFYPQIFDRRYRNDPQAAFDHLEDLMEKAKPSFGYLVLANILGTRRHNVVVTTNFDSLVADALAMLGMKRPLVCGHELLAGFVRRGLKRPLVAQVHRNLLLAPINDPEGTAELAVGWKEALERLLERSLILVVGYGGNDGSLMGYLSGVSLKGKGSALYWCHLADENLSEPVQKLLSQHDGVAVPIPGFDELMVRLGPILLDKDWDVDAMTESIQKRGAEAAVVFREAHKNLERKMVELDAKAGSQTPEAKVTSEATLKALGKAQKGKSWWEWEIEASAAKGPDEKERIYREALKALPDSAELTGNFALFMHDTWKDYDEAERLYNRALELDPNDANYTGNFALFMKNVRKNFDEAERLFRRALELDPNDAITTGNFALFMKNVRKNDDEAERLFRRALELDPNLAKTTGNFAHFMKNVRKNYDEAERLYRRALELDPNDADITGNFAIFVQDVRKNDDEAERLFRRALELDPNDANNTGNFALFMKNVRKNDDEAERLYRHALELNPDDAHHTGNFATFMQDVRKNPDEAERLYRRALELDPNDADNTANFASLLLQTGRDLDARQHATRAWNMEPDAINQTRAEAALYLLLLDRKEGRDLNSGLGRLKSLLLKGIERGAWSFDGVLDAVLPQIPESEHAWFRALADAILDPAKVSALDAYPQWTSVEPIDPSKPWDEAAP